MLAKQLPAVVFGQASAAVEGVDDRHLRSRVAIPLAHTQQEVAGEVHPVDLQTGTVRHLQIDDRQADGDSCPAIQHFVDETVARVVVSFAISNEPLLVVEVFVEGADRIAANGDTANKIGTYTVAVLAHEHNVPFYVAAPISTVDLNTPIGDAIPIEERDQREVSHLGSARLTPEGAHIRNPAFDVTPHKYIAAIITERGVARPEYKSSLKALKI